MKNFNLLAMASFIFLAGCQTELIEVEEETSVDFKQQITNRVSSFEYPSNEAVIQFDAALSEAEKQLMRDEYGVISYKQCTCADPTLELWIFSDRPDPNGTSGSLEEKLIVLKEDDGLEGANFNPFIKQQGQDLQSSFGPQSVDFARDKVKTNPSGVTIAVLDTGIDYNYFNFTTPFLYNSQSNQDDCQDASFEDFYGWDFVNQDNDPFDDYGHGTIVSNIIYESLKDSNVDFQILPVKVFDAQGNGSYFDILCGFQYAAKNKDVAIINMSFGWYDGTYDLLEKFIMESQDDKLLVTSAGNIGVSTDMYPHFPSVYTTPNILSVAAVSNTEYVGLSPFSNYGVQSVDFGAKGENIPFYISTAESIWVSGTSFAAAYTSAFAGLFYSEGISISEHVDLVIGNTIYAPSLSELKYSSYINF